VTPFPPREAAAALLLPVLLVAALVLVPVRPGAGPLGLVTAVALVHAALLAPSLVRGRPAWGLFPVAGGAPALCAASYGHDAGALGASLLLLALASLAGAAARARRSALYLPSMVLLFAAPFALGYLVLEFGDGSRAAAWRLLSPLAAAQAVGRGAALPLPCLAALLAWPAWTLARRKA